jgi:hypothetical protein
LVGLNALGEPFFREEGEIAKYSPECGERELVCSSDAFEPEVTSDYFSAASLVADWERSNGALPANALLVPVTPFVLGGEFSKENLKSVDFLEAGSSILN